MENRIAISVVIPVYNASGTIKACVDSVVADLITTLYSWEIILVDDGSKDDSLAKLTQYKKLSDYKENIFIIAQHNQGAAIARNTGMKAARGTFIAFNDSDDRWLPGKMKLQMAYLSNHPSVGMVAGVYGNDRVAVIKKIDSESVITIKDQIFKNYFSPPCVVFRKSVLEKTGLFHPRMCYAEDGYFFNKMAYHFTCVLLRVKVAESITRKERWGESGLSGNLWKMEKGELFNLYSAYRLRYVSFGLYGAATLFSLLKYGRRQVVRCMRAYGRKK